MRSFSFPSADGASAFLHCIYFKKNGTNGSQIAGALRLPQNGQHSVLVLQARSPLSVLDQSEILLQGKTGNGIPYVMAILDDVVTGLIAGDPPDRLRESPEAES